MATILRPLAALAAMAFVGGASAKDFYQGKTIEFAVSEGVGGSSDLLSRMVTRYIGRHIPGNPAIVVKNMPGAGGLAGANYLYNIADKDGLSFGMVEESIYATQLFGMKGLQADIRKFNWIGRVTSNNAVLFAWNRAAVKKIDDAFQNQLVIATPGQSSQMRWTLLKRLTGVNFKLVVGHRGTPEATVAMERGEVDAVAAPWSFFRVAHADWLREGKVNVLLQTGMERAVDLPDTPRAVDLARDPEQREILELISLGAKVGRSLVAPPGTPAERVADLRAAFTATFADPDFLAEVRAGQLNLDPLNGAEIEDVIIKAFHYSPELIAKAEALAKLD